MLRALLAALGVCIVLLLWQTQRLNRTQSALQSLQQSNAAAATAADLRAASTGQEAVSSYVDKQQADAPVVARVVERVRNVCVRAESGVSVPASSAAAGQAGSTTTHDADRARAAEDRRRAELLRRRAELEAEFVQAIPGDLAICNGELIRLDQVRNFHNANGG